MASRWEAAEPPPPTPAPAISAAELKLVCWSRKFWGSGAGVQRGGAWPGVCVCGGGAAQCLPQDLDLQGDGLSLYAGGAGPLAIPVFPVFVCLGRESPLLWVMGGSLCPPPKKLEQIDAELGTLLSWPARHSQGGHLGLSCPGFLAEVDCHRMWRLF